MFNDDWGYDPWGVRNQIWLRTQCFSFTRWIWSIGSFDLNNSSYPYPAKSIIFDHILGPYHGENL